MNSSNLSKTTEIKTKEIKTRLFICLVLVACLTTCLTSCGQEDRPDKSVKKKEKKPARLISQDSADKFLFDNPKRTLKEAKKLYLKPSPKRDKWQDYRRATKKAYFADDYNSAILLATETIQLNPNCAEAYTLRAKARYDSLEGDDKTLLADLEKAIELGTTSDDTYNLISRMYDKIGKPEKAVAALAKGISLTEDPKHLYRVRAGLYCSMGQNEKAVEDYNHLLKVNPRYSRIYAHRGQLYEGMGKNEEALEDYRKAALYDNGKAAVRVTPIALNLRIDLLKKMGRHKEAIRDLNELLKANPYEDELLRKRGDSYAALKKYKEALNDFNKAIEYEPDYARTAYESRSKIYKILGKDELAAKDMQTAKRIKTTPAEKPIY